MTKELEEIKSIVAIHFGALGFLNPIENEQILKDRDKVLNALTELQSIKESNPTEALECLERIDNTLCLNNIKGKLEFGIDTEEHTDCDSVIGMTEDLESIKQALLKAEQYKALEKELGMSIDDIKSCVIALKGLINTFNITCDTKVRMSDNLDGINGFPYYKSLVYHKEITRSIELLKEDKSE